MRDPSTTGSRGPAPNGWPEHVRARLAPLRLAPTRENEIVEELTQHLDDRWRELIAAGVPPDEARRLTLAEFRGTDVLAKNMAPLRQAQSPSPITPGAPAGLLTGLSRDLRSAARLLRKQPAFAAVAIFTVALGIGATTAIFSVVYGVLLKPLPFHEPDRLVGVWHTAPGINMPLLEHGAATYLTYREHRSAFEDIGLWDIEEVSITGNGEPERAQALRVTDGLLQILREQPLLGRVFRREDDEPGSPRRAILTHGFWSRRFGGASDVLGRSLIVDGRPHEVIGVLPPTFKYLRADPAVLLPFRFDPAEVRVGDFSYRAIARLKPGITLEQANADLARMIPLTFERFAMWPGLTRSMFDEMKLGPSVRPLSHEVTGGVGRMLWLLAGTVGIVLLIACANVANLFLVRAEARQQELAIRVALGASRSRIARELLCESVCLALVGGALGLLLAAGGIVLLTRMAPAGLPRVDEINIDTVVLLFTVAVSVLTGLLFGVVPVARLGTPTIVALQEGGRSSSEAPGRQRVRNALVVSEIAMALVLLIVSGLMMRTFIALRQVDPGFRGPNEVQTFRLTIPGSLIEDPHQTALTFEQIGERLRQVPGVVSVGLTSSVTMSGNTGSTPIFVEEFPEAGRAMPPIRRHKRIAPGYFETVGNPVLVGRSITWTDIQQGRPVVVVSENVAREYWKTPAGALGKRVRQNQQNPWREIVGVVGNESDDGLDRPAPGIVYWPMLVMDWWDEPIDISRTMTYVCRSGRVGSPGFLRELQQAVWSVNPNLPLAGVRTLEQIQADSMAQTSFALVMLAIAATVALLLATVGIYGVIVYIVTERTREIGIRVALGAQTGDVRRLFLRHGLVLTGTGIGLGTAAALGLTRLMSALLFGVSPTDPLTYAAVAAGLAAVALVATYVPARRASRTDPIVALRSAT